MPRSNRAQRRVGPKGAGEHLTSPGIPLYSARRPKPTSGLRVARAGGERFCSTMLTGSSSETVQSGTRGKPIARRDAALRTAYMLTDNSREVHQTWTRAKPISLKRRIDHG